MFSGKNTIWTVILMTAVLAGACAPAAAPEATAEPTSTLVPTPTPGPEETEHQTVMPPAPTFTSEDREPVIEVQPLTAAVGGEVVILGENFPADSQVEIGIGRVNSEYDVVGAAQTDAEGNLETTFVIPNFVQPQDRWVIVVRADSGRIEVFSEELEITG